MTVIKLFLGSFLTIGVPVILVFLPPKWDPAIRIKEWQERKKS